MSFSGNVVAHELKVLATVANAVLRTLYKRQGALKILIADLVNNPASELGTVNGDQRPDIALARDRKFYVETIFNHT